MTLPSVRNRGQYLPAGKPRIDWTHPLTNGLLDLFVYDGSSVPVSLTNGATLGANPSTRPGQGISPVGGGWSFASTLGEYAYANVSSTANRNALALFTLATPVNLSAAQSYFGYGSTAGFGSLIRLSTNSSGVKALIRDGSGTVGDISSAATLLYVGVPVALSLNAAFNGAGTNTFYVNGLPVGSSAATAAPFGASNTTSIGGTASNNSPSASATATIHLCASWGRQLSPAEHELLATNPTCFLIYPEDETDSAQVARVFVALTAGTVSVVSSGNTTASIAVSTASGGNPPYTYQWYRSTTSGFTPGAGNIISGATALTLNDTGLTNGTTYYYKNTATDSASNTATSNQAAATPAAVVVSGQPYISDWFGGSGAPQNLNAQVIVYGASAAGVIAAVEAARNGASVLLVGGWREIHVGGMCSGGLSSTDVSNIGLINGLTKNFFTVLNGLVGRADSTPLNNNNITCPPNYAELAFLQMLAQYNIKPTFTNGVASVTKSGANITGFTTTEGRTFTGKNFIDCSYEADLMAMAGVGYTSGRNAQDANDPNDGVTGIGTLTYAGGYSFKGNALNIDPYVIAGNSSSGLLPGVSATYGAYGTADKNVQAMSFRLNMQKYNVGGTVPQYFVPFPSTPPKGYNIANYECFLRYLAAVQALGNTYAQNGGTATNTFNFTVVTNIQGGNGLNGSYDWNNGIGPAGPDMHTPIDIWGQAGFDSVNGYSRGGAAEYVNANYVRREQIWENHQSWILGLFYLLQYGTDSRIPAGMAADFLTFGLDSRLFPSPKKGDMVNFPYQLYVRAARRMNSDFQLTYADLTAADGTTPRSVKTISQYSYSVDSHNVQTIVHPSGYLYGEGGLGVPAGGPNNMYPVPYDVIIPKASDCTNLHCIWAPSVSSEAFNAMRLEINTMQMGQAAGCAAALLATQYRGTSVQNLNYAALQSQLLAEGCVLPQTN